MNHYRYDSRNVFPPAVYRISMILLPLPAILRSTDERIFTFGGNGNRRRKSRHYWWYREPPKPVPPYCEPPTKFSAMFAEPPKKRYRCIIPPTNFPPSCGTVKTAPAQKTVPEEYPVKNDVSIFLTIRCDETHAQFQGGIVSPSLVAVFLDASLMKSVVRFSTTHQPCTPPK